MSTLQKFAPEFLYPGWYQMKGARLNSEAAIGDLFGEDLSSKHVLTHGADNSKKLHKPASPKKASVTGLFLNVEAVAERYDVSRAIIWRWVQNDELFPDPIKLSPGTSRWSESQLLEFETRAVLRQSGGLSRTVGKRAL